MKQGTVRFAIVVVLFGLGQASASIVARDHISTFRGKDAAPEAFWHRIVLLNQGGFLYDLDGEVTPNVVDYSPQGIYWTLYYGDLLGGTDTDEQIAPLEVPWTAETDPPWLLQIDAREYRNLQEHEIRPGFGTGQSFPLLQPVSR